MLFSISSASGQFGLRLKTHSNKLRNINAELAAAHSTNTTLYHREFEAGIDYWFRLTKSRIEFTPELSVGYSSQSISELPDFESTLWKYNVLLNIQIYALDLEGDCNCPTFSKQGATINKGLFFQLVPKLTYNNEKLLANQNSTSLNHWTYGVGIGMGLDIGISDLLTVSPIVTYFINSSFNSLWVPGVDDNPSQVQFAIRFGFRPDYAHRRR